MLKTKERSSKTRRAVRFVRSSDVTHPYQTRSGEGNVSPKDILKHQSHDAYDVSGSIVAYKTDVLKLRRAATLSSLADNAAIYRWIGTSAPFFRLVALSNRPVCQQRSSTLSEWL